MPATRTSAHLRATLLLSFLALIPAASPAADNTAAPTPEELQPLVVRDTQVGSGDEAKLGNIVDVNYTGWLYDAYAPNLHGKQFDSSVGRGTFSFMLGVGE